MVSPSEFPKVSIQAITPKVTTEGEETKVAYTIRNIGSVPLSHTNINIAVTWGSIDRSIQVDHQISTADTLTPDREYSSEEKFTPLAAGYTFFSVQDAYATIPKRKRQALHVFQTNGTLVYDGVHRLVFHSVRARSHEEISGRRATWLAFAALVVSIVALSLTTYQIHLQERTIELTGEKSAAIVVDIIPSRGVIIGDTYNTQVRPGIGDIAVDFYVLLWNVGNGSATDISVNLQSAPPTADWFDYHWSVVSIEDFSYRPSSAKAPIKVLLPDQQVQVQYHIRFIPSGYDTLLQQGKEPRIVFTVATGGDNIVPPQEYTVHIPPNA